MHEEPGSPIDENVKCLSEGDEARVGRAVALARAPRTLPRQSSLPSRRFRRHEAARRPVSRSREAAVRRRRNDAHRALLRGAPCSGCCETVGDRDAGVSCAPSSCLCDGSRKSTVRGAIDTRGGDSSGKIFETDAGDGGRGQPPQDGWPCHWRHHLRAGNPCVHFMRMACESKKTGCSASWEGRKNSSLFLAGSR